MADGRYADGSWELKIKVTDLNIKDDKGDIIKEVDIPVLVTTELHVGGVIARLVDALKSKYGKVIKRYECSLLCCVLQIQTCAVFFYFLC